MTDKVAVGVMQTPVQEDGKRVVIHPETEAGVVIVDEFGTTLYEKLAKMDESIENIEIGAISDACPTIISSVQPDEEKYVWFEIDS